MRKQLLKLTIIAALCVTLTAAALLGSPTPLILQDTPESQVRAAVIIQKYYLAPLTGKERCTYYFEDGRGHETSKVENADCNYTKDYLERRKTGKWVVTVQPEGELDYQNLEVSLYSYVRVAPGQTVTAYFERGQISGIEESRLPTEALSY